jgi:N-acetyl sugar amidotransferase
LESKYQICTKCVMDTTDPDIFFDENGICNHCHDYDLVQKKIYSGIAGRHKLDMLCERIKKDGKGKEYDSVIGVSGGVDSTYVAYIVKQHDLRPLAVHFDNGWDSELAVSNIQKTLQLLDIDLYTHVIDWEEFRDLQLAFLRASTPDSEIPTDHAINALLHQMAKKIGVRYVITGNNIKTETHLPRAWSQGHLDWLYIQSIYNKFGHGRLRSFPHMNFFDRHWYKVIQTTIDILNYIDYVKKDAIVVLEKELGWKYYGGKHYESIYTRFYQGYILPKKFGYDKRKMHLSSLICSGETTRDEALRDLNNDTYPHKLQEEDREYVIKKFEITPAEFEEIMNMPKKSYWDFHSYGHIEKNFFYTFLQKVYRALR